MERLPELYEDRLLLEPKEEDDELRLEELRLLLEELRLPEELRLLLEELRLEPR
ncbi:hypothetical protein JYK02_18700 [Corallococcus macrosporus]|uniref:Uncharacterized protein n=1 Tax=Corallococcus macrosporus TaxID=35 RepID=A0ABS3DEU6_9BACT|nr:hypothetical protein [Corallococcus macrosporus]MBN8229542.1 hypothetical protein [Corallococcus macrosporus]